MRIAQICPYSLSVPGGVQGQVLGLARALRELGHEARVLAPCDGPPPDSMVTPLGKSVPTAVNGSIAPIAPDPACALRTIHALRNENFDVLHLHEPLSPGPTFTALVASDVPSIGTFHAAGTGTAYETSVRWLGRKVAKRLNIRVAVSEDARLTAERNLPGVYEQLFNGIEVERFTAAEPWGDTGDKEAKTLLFVGRHEPRKGLSVLLEAMKLLPADIRLWVAGQGPQTAALREATRGDDRIEWLGRISEPEKLSRLRAADVFCAPSIEGESFGLVLLEGMAAGVPVVASDLPGYRKVARDGSDARLVPPGDPNALAGAITDVLQDESLAESLVRHGDQRARQFSMIKLAEAYIPLYERAVSKYPFAF
jgi:phosphatidylinositol alpha-mannosyltransferase